MLVLSVWVFCHTPRDHIHFRYSSEHISFYSTLLRMYWLRVTPALIAASCSLMRSSHVTRRRIVISRGLV